MDYRKLKRINKEWNGLLTTIDDLGLAHPLKVGNIMEMCHRWEPTSVEDLIGKYLVNRGDSYVAFEFGIRNYTRVHYPTFPLDDIGYLAQSLLFLRTFVGYKGELKFTEEISKIDGVVDVLKTDSLVDRDYAIDLVVITENHGGFGIQVKGKGSDVSDRQVKPKWFLKNERKMKKFEKMFKPTKAVFLYYTSKMDNNGIVEITPLFDPKMFNPDYEPVSIKDTYFKYKSE